jgi:hypothetical protein
MYDAYTDRQFVAVLRKYRFIVAAFLDSSKPEFESNLETFAKLPTIFSDEVKFCVLEGKKAKRTREKYVTVQGSQISFFTEGAFLFSIPFPSNELELISIVDVFLRPDIPLLDTEEKVMKAIGDTTFTILTFPSLLVATKGFVSEMSENFGSFTILQTTPEVLKKLGYSGTKPCIYRKTDKRIQEYNSDYQSFIAATRTTFYPKFDCEMLETTEGLVGLLVVEEKPTKEEKEFMTSIGDKFHNIVLGIINSTEAEEIHDFTSGKTRNTPCFVIFDFLNGRYYPIQKYSPKIEQFIGDVVGRKIQPIYPSEEIPTKQEDPWVEKVVGSNYMDFVRDPKHDVVMFYIGDDNAGLRAAHKFGKYIKKNNIQDVKVGYILSNHNSCPNYFPSLVFEPQVNIFPKEENGQSYMTYGALTVYSLLEALRKYSKNKIALNHSVFKFELELRYLVELLQDIDELLPADRASSEDFILHRGKQIGFGDTLDSVIQAIYRAAGGLVSGYEGANEIDEFEDDDNDFIEPLPEEALTGMSYPEGPRSDHRGSSHHHHRKYRN